MRILTVLILIGISTALPAVDGETWKRANQMLLEGRLEEAFQLGMEITAADEKDTFGWWLRYNTASQMATKKGRWPAECATAAHRAAELEPDKEADHLPSVVWCLSQAEGRQQEMLNLRGKVIPHSLKPIGEGNFGLMINQLTMAALQLGNRSLAREILADGARLLMNSDFSYHIGYNTAELFQGEELSAKEREKWHQLFSGLLKRKKKDNPILPAAAWNAVAFSDQLLNSKRKKEAVALMAFFEPEFDEELMKHWSFLRDQVIIRHLGLQFMNQPLKKIPKRKLRMVFVVIPKTRLSALPDAVKQFGNLDADIRDKDVEDLLLSFQYFSAAFESITGLRWEGELFMHPGQMEKTNCIREPNRFIMQPEIESVRPPLPESIRKSILEADGVVYVWAGTRQPENVLITNGGGTERDFGFRDRQMRLTIFSDSNKNSFRGGHHANQPIFLFHEMFHVLEWAYYKSDFPKKDHPYMRRGEWPSDYQGTSEWDFYVQTFEKRMKREDSFSRIHWRQRREGFYQRMDREMKEK